MWAAHRRIVAFVLLLAPIAAWAGCTSIVGDFGLGPPPAGSDATAGDTTPPPLDARQPVDAGVVAPHPVDAPADVPVDSYTCGAHCAVQAALGDYHTCVLLGDGTVSCWGDDTWSTLGDNVYQAEAGAPDPANAKPAPNAVNGLFGVIAITAGSYHTCAIVQGGTVFCWGLDDVGQCGDGRARLAAGTLPPIVGLPTQVQGISGAVEIHARGDSTCARLGDGSLTCWGMNGALNLGSASPPAFAVCYPVSFGGTVTYPCTPTPQAAQSGAQYDTFAVGQYHTCAVSSAAPKPVQCWGDNSLGQLGVVDAGASSAAPVNVALSAAASTLAAGFSHTCAALADGSFYCWGQGNDGELGDGVATSNPTPAHALLPGGTTPTSVSAGVGNTCVSLSDGTVACAGSNYAAEDGYVATDSCPSGFLGSVCSLSFRRAPVLTGANNVSFGLIHACAVQAGTLYCWGDDDFGQLANGMTGFSDGGTTRTQPSPAPVTL